MFIACIQIDRPFAELRGRREGESYERDAHETQAKPKQWKPKRRTLGNLCQSRNGLRQVSGSRNSRNTKLLSQIIITQGKYTASWGRVLWYWHKVCARGCDCIRPGKVKQRAAYFPD